MSEQFRRHFGLPQRSTPRAFTIVEMLVVISITALLFALLLPALQQAQESARDMQCKTQMRGLAQMTNFYAADHSNWLPAGRTSGSGSASWIRTWAHRLVDGGYLPRGVAMAGHDPFFTDIFLSSLWCPARVRTAANSQPTTSDFLNYKPSQFIFGNEPPVPYATGYRRMTRIDDLTLPGRVVMYAEMARGRANWEPLFDDPDNGSGYGWRFPHGPRTGPVWQNQSMIDGTVKVVRYLTAQPASASSSLTWSTLEYPYNYNSNHSNVVPDMNRPVWRRTALGLRSNW